MLSLMLVSALNTAEIKPSVYIVDSRDDSRVTYVIVNETCKVKILKKDLRDYDSVIEKVFKVCGY